MSVASSSGSNAVRVARNASVTNAAHADDRIGVADRAKPVHAPHVDHGKHLVHPAHAVHSVTTSIESASVATTLTRLAELASLRATIATEEAKHLFELASIAETCLAGFAGQSVTSTVPLPLHNYADFAAANAAATAPTPASPSAPTPAALNPEPAAVLLTKRGVAAFFGCCARTVRRMELAGELPAPVQVGRLRRWRRADLERFVESQRAEQGGPSQ